MKQASDKVLGATSLGALARWAQRWLSIPVDTSFTIDGELLERELMTPGLRSLESGSELG